RRRLPAAAAARARAAWLEPRAHGLVLHAVLGQERPVARDALPYPPHPLGVGLLEVIGRVDDRSREADQIDLSLGEPALLAELAHELVAIELLDRVHEAALVDPLDVDHLRLDAPLDRV